MTPPRLYLPVAVQKGDTCRTTEDQSRYLGCVLRMKEGDFVTVFNGVGSEYKTVIRRFVEDGAELEIVEKRDIPLADLPVTLCQAIPKAEKMDGIIRHATELGANRIIPFLSARSIPRWKTSGDKSSSHKLERWRKIAVEACRQSGRADIPDITDILSFQDMLFFLPEEGLKLIPWEEETSLSLRDVFRGQLSSDYPIASPFPDTLKTGLKTITLAIGPEGGFSVDEIEQARRHGFLSVSLGRRVLRVETASLAALAVVQYEIN